MKLLRNILVLLVKSISNLFRNTFFAKRWENDENWLKIVVLYFLEMFLFSDQKNQIVSKHNLDLVTSGSFKTSAWEKDVFDFTLDSLK